MTVYDVRGNGVGDITEIVFAAADDYYASKILKDSASLSIENADRESIAIMKKDVPMLIKALQKAVELGWAGVVPPVKPVTKKPVK